MLGASPIAAAAAGQRDTGGTMAGTVSAVTRDTLTVKGTGTESWTFMIDKDTAVAAKGATHKSLALKRADKATVLTDFVKVGDKVTVAYHDMGSIKHASRITVTTAAAPK